jgi:NAD(P)-dependent dehydrogenase (short-subunit alcohol dehydrogenase family)
MKRQKAGSIINVSSTSGLYGVGLRTPYSAAKWGVIGLTKSLAIELGPFNVRVNAICPGSVAGERIERVIAAEAESRKRTPDEVRAEYVSGQSIKRFPEAEEIADLCVFLASDKAKMISGQALPIDGNTETYHMG